MRCTGLRRCRRRHKSLHGPAPRADAFMGCGPGSAVNQRRGGAPPARPSAAVTQPPPPPPHFAYLRGHRRPGPPPAGGAGAGRGAGSAAAAVPRGAEGRGGESAFGVPGAESRRAPGRRCQGPRRSRSAAGTRRRGDPSPVPGCEKRVLGPSGRPGSAGGTCRLRAQCSCCQRGKTRPSRGLSSLIFSLFILKLYNSPKPRLAPTPGQLAKCSLDVSQQLLK